MKTKKQIIKEMIASLKEESLRMEVVRDYQKTVKTPQAVEQVRAAEKRIKDAAAQLVWLEAQ